MDQWWVTQKGHDPVGPVSTELVLRGIEAGKVPSDALICRVGEQQWSSIVEVQPFSAALQGAARTRHTDDIDEPTVVDASPLDSPEQEAAPPELSRFDERAEQTVVDSPEALEPPTLVDEPLFVDSPSSGFDDPEEKTIVESRTPTPTEPS